METKTAEQQLFEKVGTTVVVSDPLENTLSLLEFVLGVFSYNDNGWSNNVRCPFCDYETHATFTRDNGGLLYCHDRNKVYLRNQLIEEIGIDQKYPPVKSPDRSSVDIESDLREEKNKSQNLPTLSLAILLGGQKLRFNHRGQPTDTYILGDIQGLIEQSPVELHFRPLNRDEIADPKMYRALAYMPDESGMYKRSELIAPVGICVSTSKNYEKIAKITVLPNIKRVNLAPEKSSLFTQDRRKWHYNVWLESTQDSKKYPPTIDGFRTALIESIAFNGRPVVIMCFQRRNTFIIPERDSSPVGLPVEFRRELIKQKKTNLARLVDSLLLAGGCEKVALTGKRLIEIAARYGLTKSSVQRVLAQVKKPLTTAQNDTNSPCTKSENSVTGAEGQE